jgi:hypothetical protein
MRLVWVVIAGLSLSAAAPGARALQPPIQPGPIAHDSGQGVTPSFEGWFKNADGTFSLSFGYFNRNYQQTLDIPVGPGNRFEPGDADRGQPTHFLTRRQTGIFTVVVPKDFGKQTLTWVLSANGETNSIPGRLRPEWEIDALSEVTSGNKPPAIKFDPSGSIGQGPGGITTTLNTTLAAPVTLTVWATDDGVRKGAGAGTPPRPGPASGVSWSKYRGSGAVTFSERAPKVAADGKAVTTARFGAAGEYVLRVLATDASGAQSAVMAGGFQCCWTNGFVKVNVR